MRIVCWLKSVWYQLRYLPPLPIAGHIYVDKEEHKNVTVTIAECGICGDIDISWSRGDVPIIKEK